MHFVYVLIDRKMTSVFARQKLRAQELQILKDNIRKKLPVLNKAQIRRHRIPYHEALYLELQEEGFAESANFLHSLIEYQDAIRNKAEPESLVWSKPLLKDHPEMIDELYNGIKSAEKAFQNNQFGEQCDSLLKLGIFYSNQSDVWWWLAEQIFVKAVNCVCCYNLDGGKRHAFSRYLYGRYLLLQAKNAERANDQLRICRELSIGRRWSTQEILQIPQSILYIECCSLLYKALLIIAREIKQDDPLKAFKICTIAQKRAIDAQDKTGEADCLMELALCKMKAGDINNSLSWFNKVLRMQNTLNNGAGVCETHIQLAFAYSSLGNVIEAKQHLTLLLKYSKEHNLKYFYGQALRHLGEFHLNHAHPNEATKYLIEALQVFHELDDYDNREQVKNLAAISAGQELLGEYRKLIQGCNKTKLGQINIEKIISWKDRREEFWDKKCNLKMHASMFKTNKHYVEKIETINEIINKKERETTNETINEKELETTNETINKKELETTDATINKIVSETIKEVIIQNNMEAISEIELHDSNMLNEQSDAQKNNVEVIMDVNKTF